VRALATPWRYAIGTVFPLFLLFTFYSSVVDFAGLSLSTMAIAGLALLTGIPFVGVVRWVEGSDRTGAAEAAD